MDVINRIKKLLRMAEHAGSEHEAALAAERARQLMAQYEIQEAALCDDGGIAMRDPLVERHEVTDTKKRVAWHLAITMPIVEMYGAHAYTVGGRSPRQAT